MLTFASLSSFHSAEKENCKVGIEKKKQQSKIEKKAQERKYKKERKKASLKERPANRSEDNERKHQTKMIGEPSENVMSLERTAGNQKRERMRE